MINTQSHNNPEIILDKKIHKWLKNKKLQKLLTALESNNAEARIVGGAIRDALIGDNVHDIDIATTKTPQEIQSAAKTAGFKTKPTGIKHGTITVIAGKKCFHVTTLRADISTDGRHAQIRHIKNWITDAKRRDFTLNALYCDKNGHIFQPIKNSYHDILNRKVRFIGNPDTRIKEDYLRILRFFRFRARFNDTEHNPRALKACYNNRHGISTLSRERIRAEIQQHLNAHNPAPALKDMRDHHIFLHHIEPVSIVSVENLCRIIALLPKTEPPHPEHQWILKLITLSNAPVHVLNRHIALSNKDITLIKTYRAMPTMTLEETSRNYKKYLCFHDKQILHNHLIRQWATQTQNYAISTQRDLDQQWDDMIRTINAYPVPQFPITGNDLKAVGITQGTEIGRIIKELKRYWGENEGKINKKKLLEHIKKICG